jgi:hypothetical protein
MKTNKSKFIELKQMAALPSPLPQAILLALICEAWPFITNEISANDKFLVDSTWEKEAMQMLGRLFTHHQQNLSSRKHLQPYMEKWKRRCRPIPEDPTVEETLNKLRAMRHRKLKHSCNPAHPKAQTVHQICIAINAAGRLETTLQYGYPRDSSSWDIQLPGQKAGEPPGAYLRRMLALIEKKVKPLPDPGTESQISFTTKIATSHAKTIKQENIFEYLAALGKNHENFKPQFDPDPKTAAFFEDRPTLENQTSMDVLSSLVAEFYTEKLPPIITHLLIQSFQKARGILYANQLGQKFLESMDRPYTDRPCNKLHGNNLPGPDYTLLNQCLKAAASAGCKTFLLLPKSHQDGLQYIPLDHININRKKHCLSHPLKKETAYRPEKFDLGEIRQVCCVPNSWKNFPNGFWREPSPRYHT